MRRIVIIICCIFVFFSGCQRKVENDLSINKGVYYQKDSELEIRYRYNGGLYAHRLLLYDGRMYKSTNFFQVENLLDLGLKEIVDDELGKVSTNHTQFWASDSSILFEVTDEGVLYQIKGYDEEFRVGILYDTVQYYGAEEYYYNFIIFECLNDVTLNKGEDLYKEMYHLDDTSCIEGKLVNRASEETEAVQKILWENSIIQEFVDRLYEGRFIDPQSEEYSKISNDLSDDYAEIIFYDSLGVSTSVFVYEGGYVFVPMGHKMIMQMDASICQKVIELLHK